MSLFVRALLVAAAATAIGGCSRGDADLRRLIDEIKAERAAPLDPPPDLRTFETFTYQAQPLRDPFTSPVAAVDSTDDGPRPDVNRPREELEVFPLDVLDMVGTIGEGDEMLALVKDPSGLVHQVGSGSHMGQNFGRILSISETSIELVELVPNGSGGWLERPSEIALDD